jgi:hypothetical protein
MKDEALKLADEWAYCPEIHDFRECEQDWADKAEAMIRKLVEENDRITRDLIGASLYEHDYKTLMANDKPFAWSCWNDDMPSAIITFTEPNKHDWMSIKPLYTTPQTKLTDEEILEILIDKGICGRLKDGSLCYWQADADLHDFARAIEAKIRGEK